jgi:hypothetical protein
MDACDRVTPASQRTPMDAVVSLCLSAADLATRLFAGLQHRWTMQRIVRFSDHRLQDMGFERDWDGSIIRQAATAGAAPIISEY